VQRGHDPGILVLSPLFILLTECNDAADKLDSLYKSLVRSHLDYCNSVWTPYRKSDVVIWENQKSVI